MKQCSQLLLSQISTKATSTVFIFFLCLPTSLSDQEYHVSQFCKTMEETPERSILHPFNGCKPTVLCKVTLKCLRIALEIYNSDWIVSNKFYSGMIKKRKSIFLGFVCEWNTYTL